MSIEVFEPDATIEGADWIKNRPGGWDLPPYLSPEFIEVIGGPEKLDLFRTSVVYKAAVENGLIHDDEWVGDSIEGEEG